MKFLKDKQKKRFLYDSKKKHHSLLELAKLNRTIERGRDKQIENMHFTPRSLTQSQTIGEIRYSRPFPVLMPTMLSFQIRCQL